jgi:UDP-N-acetylglucosamine 2-epimerase (non-hydrolysing)
VRRLKIACVFGARPNFMKIAPIVSELRTRGEVEPVLIHTGQHYDVRMSDNFHRALDLPEPEHNLGVGSGTHTEQAARIMLALDPLLSELAPHCVVVVGDVNSTLAAALAAAQQRIPLAHVEAGLRSFDPSMPEELNRRLTDSMSDFLFTTSRDADANLLREGISPDRIFFVGNVMIDTLLRYRDQALALDMAGRLGVERDEYALVTLHRPSNVDHPDDLRRTIDTLDGLQRRLPVVFPAHPRTLKSLRRLGLEDRIRGMHSLVLHEPLGYVEFLSLLASARVVLTDSGGIQEETTILGVPCLTLRENTERPVTVEQGTNQVVGTDPERILAALDELLESRSRDGRVPELWDGRAAERIVAILCSELDRR